MPSYYFISPECRKQCLLAVHLVTFIQNHPRQVTFYNQYIVSKANDTARSTFTTLIYSIIISNKTHIPDATKQ